MRSAVAALDRRERGFGTMRSEPSRHLRMPLTDLQQIISDCEQKKTAIGNALAAPRGVMRGHAAA